MEKKRIVVKIGSSSLTNAKGEIDHIKLHDHISALAALKKEGHDVLLVSSGAVAAGFRKLGYPTRPITLKGRQAAAAVGQSLLIQYYTELFQEHDLSVAQILLTRTDFLKKERYQNAYATFTELLARNIIPIINENDTVSVAELTFGDNDMLSALVSGLVHADHLVILTDVNGLYDGHPKKPGAKRISHLDDITDEMLSYTSGPGSNVGTGGMESKLLAARKALSSGVQVFIGTGTGPAKILDILKGNGDGTYIGSAKQNVMPNLKQWISLTETSGKVFIDQGAKEAILFNGKSLLPAGVYKIEGEFSVGDVVEVYNSSELLGRGEVHYSSDELALALGKRTDEIVAASVEVIHRNNWVKTKK